jgi:molybdenum cofactor cytidylyltransferase
VSTIRGTVAAVVLAAGRGERFGADTPKPLAEFRGRPLVAHVLDAAVASGLGPVVLVVGNHGELFRAVAMPGIEVVANPHYADGIATSLHAALKHLATRGIVHAAVIGLADQPNVGAAAWSRLGSAYDEGASLAVATYQGVRANPVLLGRDHWPEAMALQGDEGARRLFSRHNVVEVVCDDTGNAHDIDTPDDLVRLETEL